jgi:hypothetical protein
MAFRRESLKRLCVVMTIGMGASLANVAQAGPPFFGGGVLHVGPAELPGWPPDVSVQSVWLEMDGRLAPLSIRSVSDRIPPTVELVMPAVRVRTEARVWLVGQRHTPDPVRASLPITILPRGTLSWAREPLSHVSVGLYDPSGRLGGLLEQERIAFARVSTRHAVDFFDGQVLLIGPDALDAGDADFFARLADRVCRGIRLLLLYQTVPWEGLGLRCERGPQSAAVRFTSAMDRWRDWIQSGDVASGQVRWYIDCVGSTIRPGRWRWQPWIIADQMGRPRAVAGRLEVVRGGLWVLQMPETRNPGDSAVGYTLCVAALLDMMSNNGVRPMTEEDEP